MLKVDLVFSGWVSAPTGLSHFVGLMKDSKELFADNGIDLRVISLDLIEKRHYANTKTTPKTYVRFALWLSKYSALITRLLIYRGYDVAAKRILDYYETLPDKGDVIAFQGIILCSEYLKRNRIHDKKILLTIHSNGDIWSMWYYRYPRLKSILLKSYRENIQKRILEGCDKIGFVADYPRKFFCNNF